jgi:hypothetical protein
MFTQVAHPVIRLGFMAITFGITAATKLDLLAGGRVANPVAGSNKVFFTLGYGSMALAAPEVTA